MQKVLPACPDPQGVTQEAVSTATHTVCPPPSKANTCAYLKARPQLGA